MQEISASEKHRVVIIGGGFGGLYAAQALAGAPVQITLVDKRNFHLFQPLLYQVATGGLSPADIASPLRAVLKRQTNIDVIQAEMVDLDPGARRVVLDDGELSYNTLMIATGVDNHYFGNPTWPDRAPGLKSLEDALEIRGRVFRAFEAADRESDPRARQAWMTFVIIGGGPTGVELAGALGELKRATLAGEFKHIDPAQAKVLLLEGQDYILQDYDTELTSKAQTLLEKLGVTVRTGAMVKELDDGVVSYNVGDEERRVESRTVLWAAGMKAVPVADTIAKRTGADQDWMGRLITRADLSLPGHPEILVLGDAAHFAPDGGDPLPGVAPVAIQQGRFAADLVRARLSGENKSRFEYLDKGSLAVIGRNAAVAEFGRLKMAGVFAWLAWIFVHLWYLVEYDNKVLVIIQWAWNYFTRKRGARLIAGNLTFRPSGAQDRPVVAPDAEHEAAQLEPEPAASVKTS